MLWKLVIGVNTGDHLSQVLNERSINDKGNLRPLWFVILKSVGHSIGDTAQSCSTVGCEMQWAILCSLLCPEMDWNICFRKQGYMFILTDFKKWWSDVSFLIPVSTIILRLRKVKFETKHDQFCVWLILAQLAADWECSHIFSESFSQKRNCFFLLLPAFCTCSMLWEDFFFAQSLKI